MDKAKLLGVLLVGIAAGAAPSIVASDKAELKFTNVSVSARGLSDGGTLYQIAACADVYKEGKRTREVACANKFSPDAGDFAGAVNASLKLSKEVYEASLKKK